MYSWVSAGSIRKYHRAVAELTKDKKEVTEEAVKALYVKSGGLVLEEEAADEEEVAEEAPKRRKKSE